MGNYDHNTELSEGQLDKATKFLVNGNVMIEQARVFTVEGDTGEYTVIIFDDTNTNTHTCTCPRIGTCSHIAAALTFDEELTRAVAEAEGRTNPRKKKVTEKELVRRTLRRVK